MRIHLISLHGLFRGKNLEIGRDADNGGQIIYVMELARELSRQSEVQSVHLFTRRIEDKRLSPDYAVEVEQVNEKLDIRRIACGGKKYLPKEKLWPHLDEFVSNAIQHIKSENILPDWIHSHYADAGYVASELSAYLHIPYAHTAHSLGKPKLKKLLNAGMMREEAYEKYAFQRRFEAEESTLANAEFIVTSTHQEISQFDDYENTKLCEYHVIPPGLNFQRYYPYYEDVLETTHKSEEEKQAMLMVKERVERFLSDPSKPVILTICRPDRKKNIDGLIHAYGTDPELQSISNLVIFAGIRGDIVNMPQGEKEVLTQILLLMDKYNLYGRLAIPKKHDTEWEVPEIYRFCARRKGVFVNLALTEPFGLTILEATSCGLPVVATKHGGPSESLPRCQNGALVDPENVKEVQEALKRILIDEENWQALSNAGIKNVRKHYSWTTHSKNYLELVTENRKVSQGVGVKNVSKDWRAKHPLKNATAMLITDIDGTLISETGENDGLEEFKEILRTRGHKFVFGLATGRSLSMVRDVLEEYEVPLPDLVISSVGASIYYGLDVNLLDKGWQQHIKFRWQRDQIERAALKCPGLELQEEIHQKPCKISFYIHSELFNYAELQKALGPLEARVNVMISRNAFLDILPKRASKGKAVRYLSQKWSIPLGQTIVCGDSGNDLDMFHGSAQGVVVKNCSAEMEPLRKSKRIYFTEAPASAGVIEALRHYQLI